MATPTPQEIDLVSQHPGAVKWLLGVAGSAILALAGWIFKRHDDAIASLQKDSHKPETCSRAGELEADKVNRKDFEHAMERLFDKMDAHRDEVLGEVKSLREEVRVGLNARPTREELKGI